VDELAEKSARGLRSTILGLLINVALATTKLAAGLLGNSHALVADAIESMADIFASLVVWSGLRISVQPRTRSILTGMAGPSRWPLFSLPHAPCAAIGITIEALQACACLTPHRGIHVVGARRVILVKEVSFDLSTVWQSKRIAERSRPMRGIIAAMRYLSRRGHRISIALIGGKGYERRTTGPRSSPP